MEPGFWSWTLDGQTLNRGELLVDNVREFEWIEAHDPASKFFDFFWVGVFREEHPLPRCLGFVVDARNPSASADFLQELDRRLEDILKEPQLVAVEVVHGLARRLRLEATVAEELAHMRPVLLLDVGVVVFLVGPTAREANLSILAETHQRVVDELAA